MRELPRKQVKRLQNKSSQGKTETAEGVQEQGTDKLGDTQGPSRYLRESLGQSQSGDLLLNPL